MRSNCALLNLRGHYEFSKLVVSSVILLHNATERVLLIEKKERERE
jgi:hypothetical protein